MSAHHGERPLLTCTAPAQREAADDAALRARAAAGDSDAFGELAAIYRPTIYTFVYHRCGRNRELADDVTQETFTRALRRVTTFQEMGRGFGAWLTRIAANLLNDYWKSGWCRYNVAVDMYSLEPAESRALQDEQEPVDEVMAREAAAAIREAMTDLTGEQREVIELRFFSGLSVAQTAAKLDKQEGAVKAAQYRAVRVLARHPLLAPWAPWAVSAA